MARKGILTADNTAATTPAKKAPAPPRRGAVGALQSSLTKLQEAAVQDIDANLIDNAGVEDRLGRNSEASRQLRESLQAYGQQVPVLLRPHGKTPGRYEIVYGRRRVDALKELGMPVKAMIRQLDDAALIMAQGQENTARQDLSFIEKASFAAQLDGLGFDRETICAALSIDMPMVSRMLTVGKAFPLVVLRKIGPAPGIGRDRWLALIKLFDRPGARNHALAFLDTPDSANMPTDDRFEAIFNRAKTHGDQKETPKATPSRPLRSSNGTVLGDVKRTAKATTVRLPNRTAAGFGVWFEENAEDLIKELHDRWTQHAASEETE